MKLLLTSAGLKNQSIIRELQSLAGKDLRQCKAVYVITAANVERGDKSWLITNLSELVNLFGEVDIVNIALPKDCWEDALHTADVIVMGGGNTTYLMKQVRESGAEKTLRSLLSSKVYVGISAGSMIATPTTAPNSDSKPKVKALSLVGFGIQPHYQSEAFALAANKALVQKRIADNQIDYPVYALDDQSAISVTNGTADVVSEGHWELLE